MYRVKSGNKYNAQSTYFNGITYDSRAEAGYAAELELRRKAGEIRAWTPHVRLPLSANGQHICDYEIDFQVLHHDGHFEFIEVKGMETQAWRFKWKLFEATFKDTWPDADLTVVKVGWGRARNRWTAGDVARKTC